MNIRELFTQQKKNLDHFFLHLDVEKIESVFNSIFQCSGTLFLTGVGKSGFIAQKIAATLLSTGTKAHFLPPIDAIHGDLGMISQGDLLLVFSKSGQTQELLSLLPFIRSKGAQVVAITSDKESRLAKSADFSIELPCEGELCPYDLAPTTSTEIQLLLGDALSIYLMRKKGFALDQYAQNHPAGTIGRQITTRVRDLMVANEQAPFCLKSDLLEKVLIEFTEKRCGCLVVVDENRELEGIFTDGDLRRALQEKGERVLAEPIGNMMTAAPRSIQANALALEAVQLMQSDQKKPITILPVVETDEVIGVIKLHDLIQAELVKS